MVYDDDTGRRVFFDLEDEGRPSTGGQRPRRPSPETQEYIVRLGNQPGWDAERVHAYLRIEHNRHDISLAAIIDILTESRVHASARQSRRRRRHR